MNYELAKYSTAISMHLWRNCPEHCTRWISFHVRTLEPTLAAHDWKKMESTILATVFDGSDPDDASNDSCAENEQPVFTSTPHQKKTITLISKELKKLLRSVPVNNEWLRNQDKPEHPLHRKWPEAV